MIAYSSKGEFLPLTAPAAGFVKDTAILIGDTVVIPQATAAVGVVVTCFVGPGVVAGLPKTAGVAFAEGGQVRFIGATSDFGSAVLAGNYPVGKCANVGGVLAGAATVDVAFEGTGISGT
jgi:hypothetical protein